VRVGLPTLVACLAAIGPGVALRAPALAAQDAAALIGHVSTTANSVLNVHRDGHGRHGGADAADDVR
jgi:hypothetical protein